jgi:hypothetical protein
MLRSCFSEGAGGCCYEISKVELTSSNYYGSDKVSAAFKAIMHEWIKEIRTGLPKILYQV